MTIRQELDAFLDKHNAEAREAAKVSLCAACVLWPISLLAVLFFGWRMIYRWSAAASPGIGLLNLAGPFILLFVGINAVVTVVLVLRDYEHEAVVESADPGGVHPAALAWSFFLLPARMTADGFVRRKAVVDFSDPERQAAESLMLHLKNEGGPVSWRQDRFPPDVVMCLVRIKAVRLENDRYGNPVLSRRLPPEPAMG